MFRTPHALFRTLALAETVTWTILIAALIARALGAPPAVVAIGGSVHGFVFLAYAAAALLVAVNQRWGAARTLIAIVSAAVPYATIPVERWLHRRGLLAGAWRLEASGDPRDQFWLDRLVRAFLNRPWLLALLLLAAIGAAYLVLLQVGPPVGQH